MAPLTNATVTHIITNPLLPAHLGHDGPPFFHDCYTFGSCLLRAFLRSEFLSDLLKLNYSATTLGVITLVLPILFYPFFPVVPKRFILPETILILSSLQLWVFQLLGVLLRCLSDHSGSNGIVIGGLKFHALDFAWWMMPLTEFLGITYWSYRRLFLKAGLPPQRRVTPRPQGRKHEKKSGNHEILNADPERQPLLEGEENSELVSYSDLEKGHGGNGNDQNISAGKYTEETATKKCRSENMDWAIKPWDRRSNIGETTLGEPPRTTPAG